MRPSMASCGNVQVRALDGGRCTRVATRGQDSHHGADLDASLGMGVLGGVGPASPARSNVRRVCTGSTLGRRSGSAFTVGLSSSGVVVLRGRPSGRAARKAAARSLSTTTNWLWAVAITACPHVTRSGRTVVYTR